jgi:hypothetical protein
VDNNNSNNSTIRFFCLLPSECRVLLFCFGLVSAEIRAYKLTRLRGSGFGAMNLELDPTQNPALFSQLLAMGPLFSLASLLLLLVMALSLCFVILFICCGVTEPDRVIEDGARAIARNEELMAADLAGAFRVCTYTQTPSRTLARAQMSVFRCDVLFALMLSPCAGTSRCVFLLCDSLPAFPG